MYQDFFAKSDLLVWPVMALLIFVMIFVGVLAYVFLGLRDKNKIDRMASLPFEPESNVEEPADGTMDDSKNGRTR